ncbi:hypothetical protein ClosIBUN13A_CONTIG120g01797 [Clostridium sp. IBUN13A]|jgi:hypothetical protein|uniref:Uncharacterized protein n=2 Tax=Clostridium butyricum TaxID=1492 RepID=A0A512TP75_CLOBU|nr:MAG: hypothetical protein Q607_CBUC00021G0064 [Clostridium butyricum DORA_1]KJZ87127.1 hypothetical protein ClosIBUN125C_CONTIG36g01983 [Clostridium sp. IBUN125C]KJZ91166.1 hypothetical protein ClosIBUN62F_CONTIG73g02577 [Clostridium sp. IBUN62F]KJZ94222.1 hypothetical protein ClosIBUN22A_CONTIG144g02981 [Clostridium sp. IBUN22A]KJZ97252.1 hypothetical protein ClosIBUN13A_CONTIG120g01797 [Clostridium sp. IBUN13A]NOW23524.1 truncated hemoglobin YjbI [Clostridium butyricum]
MRENYNSFDYWENVIRENKTIRGHMFMQKPPTEKSLYFHTLIFSKGNGMNNIWGYFPNVKSLIGYLQYSFLQESFYKWIHGKDKLITRIPSISVEKVIEDGERAKKITKEIADKMKKDYQFLSKLWDMPSRDAERELKKFLREFNKKWIGDNREFLYIKLFESPKEVGDFVVSSATITNSEGELESKIGMKIDEWLNLCENTLKDKKSAEKFRQILLKRLSEVL